MINIKYGQVEQYLLRVCTKKIGLHEIQSPFGPGGMLFQMRFGPQGIWCSSTRPARQNCSTRPMAKAEDTNSFFLTSLPLPFRPSIPSFFLLREVWSKFFFRVGTVMLCAISWAFISTVESFLIVLLLFYGYCLYILLLWFIWYLLWALQ